MRFYEFMARLFPQSLVRKLLVVIAGPVAVFAVGGALAAGLVLGDQAGFGRLVLWLGAGSLIGAGVATVLVVWLLAPVYSVNAALARFAVDRRITPLPQNHRDGLGALMANTTQMMMLAAQDFEAAVVAAEFDPLTGVMNRRGFERVLPEMVLGTILYIDIDHFKRINDEWGHSVGDETLVAVCDAISSALRSKDVVARIGGEEFAVFADETVASRSIELADRVRQRVRDRVKVWSRPVTVSIGVAVCGEMTDRDLLLAVADDGLYDAKARGRDTVVLGAHGRAA